MRASTIIVAANANSSAASGSGAIRSRRPRSSRRRDKGERSLGGSARPNRTVVLARPTGVGRALATCTCTIPIEGRDEWLAAAGLRA